jgi:hypothetical protein
MGEEKNKFSGMTLNEMLFEAGLIKEFDKAVKEKNESALIQVLQKINIPTQNAKKIINTIFNDLKKYGFRE